MPTRDFVDKFPLPFKVGRIQPTNLKITGLGFPRTARNLVLHLLPLHPRQTPLGQIIPLDLLLLDRIYTVHLLDERLDDIGHFPILAPPRGIPGPAFPSSGVRDEVLSRGEVVDTSVGF